MLRHLREIIQYRSLIRALVVRHLAMRYRGSLLGFIWSFLNPLCLMLVYMLVFKYYIRFNQVDNYTIFLFVGLLPWLWLSSGLLEGTVSIAGSGHLITKSLFPAQILPLVAVITSMINFMFALPLLFLFIVCAGLPLHGTLLLLPFVIAMQFLLLVGMSLCLGALNVRFRDVQHLLGNLLTFLFFLCPILYPVDVVPEKFRFTLHYNPLALLTRFYQQVILEGTLPSLASSGYLIAVTALILVIGCSVFDYFKESFAEAL